MDAAPPLVNVLQESDSAILQPLFKDPYQLKGHEFDNIKMELTSLAHFETELKLAKQGDLCIMKGKAEVAQIDIFANRVIRWNEGYYITPKDLLEYYP